MSDSSKPDFRNGIGIQDLPDGTIVQGRVDAEDAILIRRGEEYFAVGAQCTHYHAALASGLVSSRNVKVRWPRSTCSAVECPSMRYRSFGASTTKSQSTTSGTRKYGTPSKSKAPWPRIIVRSLTGEMAALWPSQPYLETLKVCEPSAKWSARVKDPLQRRALTSVEFSDPAANPYRPTAYQSLK
jgi:nitrite reductase/ring-hydroxylating ferredoxin subunit